MPYLDVNQIEILLNDLPEAEDPGRSGTTATTRVQASRAVLGPRACATSMLAKIKVLKKLKNKNRYMKNEYGISPYQKKLCDAMLNEFKQLKNDIQEQFNEYWVMCLNTGEQLKLQSSSLRAHDNSRSVNLRACVGMPQTRDETSWETGETSRSTCLRAVDSEEDPEHHETRRKGEASPSTCLRVVDGGEDLELQDGQDDFAVDDEKTTDIETWVVGKMPAQNRTKTPSTSPAHK